ncbi:hypothetical protein GGS23DRAFT_599335 [Durotheca rogersii]|uniref:uncharacterized protein n=1 Tax=Durotheca rogersii TaxID=419775 RepID=UPI00221F6EC8|nr:uncharacterized protein GGS23DRAFT_599335 [Durotheca rogersii]KAI5860522.1 hypothetical protein GGS23DRAFT_599335 [Durotheca rogersii]
MQISAFVAFFLGSTAVLAAPARVIANADGDAAAPTTTALQDMLARAFGLDPAIIAELTRRFPNDPTAEDCAGERLSFGERRQCIDAGFLDDPSF